MPVGEEGDEDELDDLVLAHDDAPESRHHLESPLGDGADLHRSSSMVAMISRTLPRLGPRASAQRRRNEGARGQRGQPRPQDPFEVTPATEAGAHAGSELEQAVRGAGLDERRNPRGIERGWSVAREPAGKESRSSSSAVPSTSAAARRGTSARQCGSRYT